MKDSRPIGISASLPTTSNHLQAGTIDKSYIEKLGISRDIIPIEHRNFDINSAIVIFKEAMDIIKSALNLWERFLIFIGKLEAPELSEKEKIVLIKDIPYLKDKSKSERMDYYKEKFLPVNKR